MSGIMDDDTLRMYIQESREHLETIESDLLKIEQLGKAIDEELVNKVFRAAHSIKGGGGFLGLDVIKELAHKIENVLDAIRNYELVPGPDVINTVLVAFDHLGVLLDNALTSNDMDISEHVRDLEALTVQNMKPEEKESVRKELVISHADVSIRFTITEYDLKQALRNGKILYILHYDLIKHIHRQDKVPMDVIKRLEDGGEILDVKLSLAEVGDLDSETISPAFPMYVLYSSIIEPDLIGTVIGLPETNIHIVDEKSAVRKESREPRQPVETKERVTEEMTPVPERKKVEEHSGQETVVAPKRSVAAKPEERVVSGQSETLRVHVQVLNQLMNRAGELVLARNQLLQALSLWDKQSVMAAGQRVDLVTSELQEIIMLTRMQPMGNIFNKFPRVVRDIARQLDKEINLEIVGGEVEVDKTIIEGLGDPLTHLVRNAADHGIELPAERRGKGKKQVGHIILRAFHESGQVIVEIEDDGKGLDPEKILAAALRKNLISAEEAQTLTDKDKINLIMLPGFSTAEKVTDVSGRGVGMDVVKTNLDKLGGQVEIISRIDKGTIIRIKLPLTLAIIPSLLITSSNERFALPQVNVRELLRISANEIRQKIEKIGGAEVLILRGELIPLLYLNRALSLENLYYDPKTGESRPDRRAGLMDERLENEETPSSEGGTEAGGKEAEVVPERRTSRQSDINIVVVQAGSFKYGLVVDKLHDTVEIVVKPLGRHLAKCNVFAGATIMGDGHVALILDVPGLAHVAELKSVNESERAARREAEIASLKAEGTRQTLLLFRNGPEEQCGVPLHLVLRVEQIRQDDIEVKGGKKVIQHRGTSLPVYALEEAANVEMLEATEQLNVIIFVVAGREVGLLAVPPLDILDVDTVMDETTLKQPGISGSAIIRGKTTLLVDIFGLMETLNPTWFAQRQKVDTPAPLEEGETGAGQMATILLAEDSSFFRAQVKQFVEAEGYVVVEAEDGEEAWSYMQEHHGQIDLVLTDIEMPRMDGIELTRILKADERFAHLPVIALTSLAGEEDVAKGREAGIDDYQIKIDKENLLQGIYRLINKKDGEA